MDAQTLVIVGLLFGVVALLVIGVAWTIKITQSLPSDLDSVFFDHESSFHKKT